MSQDGLGFITGRVTDNGGHPIHRAEVTFTPHPSGEGRGPEEQQASIAKPAYSDAEGYFRSEALKPSRYYVQATAFEHHRSDQRSITVESGSTSDVPLVIASLNLSIEPQGNETPMVGKQFMMRIVDAADRSRFEWSALPDARAGDTERGQANFLALRPGVVRIEYHTVGTGLEQGGGRAEIRSSRAVAVDDTPLQRIGGHVNVALSRTAVYRTEDQVLWSVIRDRTDAINFNRYRRFMDRVIGIVEDESSDLDEEKRSVDEVRRGVERRVETVGTHLHGIGAYQILKFTTEAFLLLEAGVRLGSREYERHHFSADAESARLSGEVVDIAELEERLAQYLGHPRQLPYIKRVVRAAFPRPDARPMLGDRVLMARMDEPVLLELIWSYWHEEGMLMQAINAVALRFQNVRAPGERDPLAYLEIDPLRPLNNVLWGYIQDEPHRLTVSRRAYEYEHGYGLALYGKAARSVRPADSRSKFIEAFHNLLHLASVFYKEDNDTTVIADGYPLLNALKEVHLLLAQGAHNQFGDLPWTARAEMMLAEWMLARPEMRDFIQARVMVPYKEPWMPQVDTMKTLQGWTDVTITHFRDLGVYGEQILLSVRYGDWIAINDEDSAKNWARYWRPEIQGYMHAYRAVTGIDLTNPDSVDSTVPAVYLQKRLSVQQQRMR
jgi:hypothetical protein